MSEQLELDVDSPPSSPTDKEVSSEPHTDADVPKETTSRSSAFAKAIGRMAYMMKTEGRMSTGALAELRRVSPDRPFTPSLWYLLLDVGEAEAWGGLKQPVYERRMATLAMGLATCAGLHDYRIPLGRALAKAGWSELRFVRLMEARGETLERHVRRMAQYLASKSQRANWTDVGWLLLGQDWDTAKQTRLRISRSYYSTLHAQKQA